MEGREIEPRKTVWAVAEVCWQEADGRSFHAPATLEDTSISGACVRVKRPFTIGSEVTIKWHREQFSAIARNCRRDGRDFLLGVHREPAVTEPELKQTVTDVQRPPFASQVTESPPPSIPPIPAPQPRSHSERKVMQSKSLIPQFWRRPSDSDAPAKPTTMEATVNKSTTRASEAPSGARSELLSYEDIYRAAGILSPGSGYGIHKVVDMLNSDRIRDLSKDVKRASVLMALDAAGISVDDLLTDATRRQNALASYESGQRQQLETFETRKGQENARIEEEMEKIRAHYAARIQNNLDLVAKEKEALRNWQSAMQHESQRIAEVIELCGKQPTTRSSSMAAAAGASTSGEKPLGITEGAQALRPNSLAKE